MGNPKESQRLQQVESRHAEQMSQSETLKARLKGLRSSVETKLNTEESLRLQLTETEQKLESVKANYDNLHKTADQQSSEITDLQDLLSTVIDELENLKKQLDGEG